MSGIFSYQHFVPLSRVESARAVSNEHGVEMTELRMKDGETRSGGITWDDFGGIPLQIIPAESGCNFLHAWTDGDDPDGWGVGRTPLIGWALCLDNQIRPVTASGVNDGCSEPQDTGNFVEMPNGKVVSSSPWASRAGYDSADEYLVEMLQLRGKARPIAGDEQ